MPRSKPFAIVFVAGLLCGGVMFTLMFHEGHLPGSPSSGAGTPSAEGGDATARAAPGSVRPSILPYRSSIPASHGMDGGIDILISLWAQGDPQAAVAWASSLPGENGRTALVAAVWGWAGTDPVAAADHVSGIEDFALRQELVSAVIQSWDRTDLADASAWIEENLPDTAGRAGAYEDLAYVWIATDRVAASQWIGAMTEGPERDAAVKMLVREVSASDPEAAAAWVDTLSGAALRESWKKRLNGR